MTVANALRLALAVSLIAGGAEAQRQGRPMGRPLNRQDQDREALEGQVRREFARLVRERVGLSDDQVLKLGPLTRKYEQQRRTVQSAEREARIKLQAIVVVGAEADSVKINGYVAELMDVRRRRLQIDEEEQKELLTIMTPLQRARYLGIQEQIRRRLEQMRPMPGGLPDNGGPARSPPPPASGAAR